MELSHLLNLISELPENSEFYYVRSNDKCRFISVDTEIGRVNGVAPNGEGKSWAPSYLADLAPKIQENVPFNLSGILNNKGSYRPILETIIAHTREFYTVRQGTATLLVWVPSKPKAELDIKEISEAEIPAPADSDTVDVCMAIVNPLQASYTKEQLADELKKMYASLKSSGVHLFGLKFGKHIVDYSVKDLSDIAEMAGLSANYSTEINKLKNVYQAIHEHKFGVSFYDEICISGLTKSDIASADSLRDRDFSYLRAMRTKPFLLLAGISGTGKSRIVKQMAFDSCPDLGTLRCDPTSPGNYCLIEVKPNWHDSTELLGYESQIGHPHYQLTPFVQFLAKAMLYPEVPFFVCLDEMNLAPVEQYFAEFLSVLESRTKIDGHIVSEPIIKADIFRRYNMVKSLFSISEDPVKSYGSVGSTIDPEPYYGREAEVYARLKEEGLRIPENVVVIGTVNMDETTHQFSRKVIDRAMTIEMNLPDGEPFMDFFNNSSELRYRTVPTSPSLYLATETRAADVVSALAQADAEKTEWLKVEVARFLTDLNLALGNTPFKVAYRVQNELMLYFYQIWLEDPSADWNQILATSCDQILMMKVLPRVEGDDELLEHPLRRMLEFCTRYPDSYGKVSEMKERLERSRFASFWP